MNRFKQFIINNIMKIYIDDYEVKNLSDKLTNLNKYLIMDQFDS